MALRPRFDTVPSAAANDGSDAFPLVMIPVTDDGEDPKFAGGGPIPILAEEKDASLASEHIIVRFLTTILLSETAVGVAT